MTSTLLLAGAMPELGLVVRATIVIGAAWAAAALLQKAGASAAARHMAWLLGLAALLALPLLRWLVPALQLPILPSEAVIAAPTGLAPELAASEPQPWVEQAGWSGLVLVAYLLGAAALLLRIAAGRHMLARLWREAEPARDPAWEELLSGLSLEMGLARPIQLRIASGPAMPMTWGTLAPKILLPAQAPAWPAERRRLVLLHELAHVERRDSLSRSLASLACALYWFHPGAWFAARRMRMEQEHAADDRVLAAGGSARTYALSLLHLARRVEQGLRPDLAATMAGTCQLERRLVSITGPARRDRPSPAFLSTSALLAASATLVVATAVPVGATPTPPASRLAEPAGIVAPVEKWPTPAETLSATADALEVPASEGPAEPSSEPAPVTGPGVETVQGREPRSPREEESLADRQVPADGRRLPEIGWALRPGDPKLEIDSSADPSRAARLNAPSRRTASKERSAKPKWARLVPRLLLPGTSKGPGPGSSESPATLSVSLDVGAR